MNLEPSQDVPLDPDFASRLLQEARAGLVVAASHEESGLLDSKREDIRGKVLSITQSPDGRPQIRVDSQGLGLDQKLFVERILLRHLDLNDFSFVSVYFQKVAPLQNISSDPIPVKRKAPFDLKIQKKPIPGVRRVIAVGSGKGGVGKSTIATNLSVSLAQKGRKVGLMDCDVYGPSAQMMLGITGSMPVSQGKLVPLEGHQVKVVSFGFMSDVKAPVIWRGPLVAKAIEQLCFDVQWGELDDLILDLPPGTGDVQMTLAEKLPISGAIIVTTSQDIALIDAHKAVSMFEKLDIPILGVVQNMAFHECSQCGHQDPIFGEDAFTKFVEDRQLKHLIKIPLATAIRESSDNGLPATLSKDPHIYEPYRTLADHVINHFQQSFLDKDYH